MDNAALYEAVNHAREKATELAGTICGKEHGKLALWLEELAAFRGAGESPYPDGDESVLACPRCGSGEYLHNADENENDYCGQCGQKIEWPQEVK